MQGRPQVSGKGDDVYRVVGRSKGGAVLKFSSRGENLRDKVATKSDGQK